MPIWGPRMLEARQLRVGYGAAPAVWDISLDVGEGDLVVVVGPNGAGKTTLLQIAASARFKRRVGRPKCPGRIEPSEVRRGRMSRGIDRLRIERDMVRKSWFWVIRSAPMALSISWC